MLLPVIVCSTLSVFIIFFAYLLINRLKNKIVDGDYFHSNPSVYQEHQLNGMQKKNKRNDLFKNALASTMGYGMFRVWEKDLKENLEDVKVKLKLAIDGKK